MIYVKIDWHHDCPEDPICYYMELDEEGYDVRRLELFADGHYEFWDKKTPFALSDCSCFPLEEISAQEEFSLDKLSKIQFEEILSAHPVEDETERLRRYHDLYCP